MEMANFPAGRPLLDVASGPRLVLFPEFPGSSRLQLNSVKQHVTLRHWLAFVTRKTSFSSYPFPAKKVMNEFRWKSSLPSFFLFPPIGNHRVRLALSYLYIIHFYITTRELSHDPKIFSFFFSCREIGFEWPQKPRANNFRERESLPYLRTMR